MPPVVTRTPMKLSTTTVAREGYLDAVYGTETPSPVRKLHADFMEEEEEDEAKEEADRGAPNGEAGEAPTPSKQLVVKRWAVREGPALGSPKVGVLQPGEHVDVAERLVDATGRSWVRCDVGWATTHDSRGNPVLADAPAPPASPDLLSAYLQPSDSPAVKGPRTVREPLADKHVNGHSNFASPHRHRGD